jgi:hypothetical protein
MQTKSLLSRIAIPAGATLAVLALLWSVKTLHRARLSDNATTHMGAPATTAPPLSPKQKADLTRDYGKLPLVFEANGGQTAPEVHYLAHGQGYQLFLTSQEAVLALRRPASGAKPAKGASLLLARRAPNAIVRASTLRMHFDGANPAAEIAGTNPLPGRVNYFIGNDPQKWHTDIPSYEAVRYQGIYPGVDVLFYGHGQSLEYDFVVAPGADPEAIALSIAGARKLELDSRGDALMEVTGGKVVLQKPVIYQETNGVRREIAGNYSIAHDRQIRFSVAAYDHTQPLIVDPLLNYSTYVGGESFDAAAGIALDTAGNAYIAGRTTSTTFPQMNPVSGTTPADLSEGTVFVSELNPTGTALLYSTYLGGSGNGSFGEAATAIAVDTASPANVYLTGFTGSTDFPVSTVLLPSQGQPGPAGTSTGGSAFITKLAPSASGSAQLAYSSYLGGDTSDEGFGIAVDGSGNAYIAGETMSTNFPQKGTQITPGQTSSAGDAFLTKIDTTASGAASLVYSTYLGGSGAGSNFLPFGDVALGIVIDTSSDAYVVGSTTSTDFPTAGTAVAGSEACGANTNGSAFISVINTTAQTLTYSHCLSGNNYEAAFGITLGTGVPAVATKVAYITGTTGSSNFPVTANSIPPAGTVQFGVAFVSLLNTATGTLQYSTYLGGTNSDTGFSIGSDSSGNAYVTGLTVSKDFPITQGALEAALNNPTGEAFISKISPNGNGVADLVYSSYFGGQATNTLTTPDEGRGIAVSATNAYIAGQMASPDMPVSSGAFQTSLRAAGATANAFVADLPLTPTISVSPTSINFGTQLVGLPTAAQFVTLTNNTSSSVTLTLPPTFVGANASDFTATGTGGTCGASLAAGAGCTVGVTFTPSAAGARAVTMKIVDSLDTAAHPIQVALTGTGSTTIGAIAFSPTSLTFTGQLLTTTSAGKTLTISNPSTTTALSISAIAVSNADFTIASNSCGNTFPIMIAASPGGTPCMLSITFGPAGSTAPGPDAGTIMVTDNANASPQSVPLTGTAWDFSVSTSSSVTLGKGQMGTFPVTITGLGGFTGMVSFTCMPGNSLITSCAVPTTAAAAAPGATATGTLTASSFIVAPQSMKVPPAATLRQVFLVMLIISLLFMIPATRRFRTRMGIVGAMLVFIVAAGCNGGAPKPKTSTIVITPSSGGVTKAAITVNVTITE